MLTFEVEIAASDTAGRVVICVSQIQAKMQACSHVTLPRRSEASNTQHCDVVHCAFAV